MQFEILNDWDDFLSKLPDEKKDLYYSKQYLELYADEKNVPQCAAAYEGDSVMLMPYMRGEINGFYDFETAYGYGGPISNSDDDNWNHCAFRGIYDLLKSSNYLCGFTRFHPLLHNESLVEEESETRSIKLLYDRKTIAIDTSGTCDDIWSTQINSKNRNMIRKAEKNELIFNAEYDYESYDEFIKLYDETMKRLNADEFYFFDRDYYYRLKENLKGQSFLGTIKKDGKLICAAIFMYSKAYGHYHLEGSDREYSGLGANNLLLWKAACEMNKLGIKEFHLGGGTSGAEDDSLYKFKKAFSPNEKSFYIGKEIFKPDEYERIAKVWEENNPDKVSIYGNRLLKYRY